MPKSCFNLPHNSKAFIFYLISKLVSSTATGLFSGIHTATAQVTWFVTELFRGTDHLLSLLPAAGHN